MSADELDELPRAGNLCLQVATSDENIPSHGEFEQWAGAALPRDRCNDEITVRIVGRQESQQLNLQFRSQPKPTNVLSFGMEAPPGVPITTLGDLVICASVVEEEAIAQKKALNAHWAHMVVHGVLHLLGHDHQHDREAEAMEALETEIMQRLDFPAPYE